MQLFLVFTFHHLKDAGPFTLLSLNGGTNCDLQKHWRIHRSLHHL